MPENVSIAYRGANYAIGQGPQFYGIWHAAAPQDAPIEWWPLTPQGWTGAWSRFASIEVPGSIAPASAILAPPKASVAAGVTSAAAETSPATGTPASSETAESLAAEAGGLSDPQAAGEAIDPHYGQVVERPANHARMLRNYRIGAALLAVGVLLGLIGLFPDYFIRPSLAAQPGELVPHVIYLAAWAGSVVLVLLSGVRRQAGALIAAGVSVVTFGMFFSDLGTPIAYGGKYLGAGLILSLVGWLACTAGAVVACAASGQTFRGWRAASRRARLTSHDIVITVVMILAAIGAAIAFAPSWDSYLLQTAAGTSETVTLGNAFASTNPVPVIAGDVAVMVLVVAALVLAALWRPIRLGAALAAGALIPMLAQAISAFVQVSEPTSPQQFGFSQAQASELGLKITNGLTPMLWVYCAFLGLLILLYAWMLFNPDSAADRAPAHPGLAYPGQPQAGLPYPAPPYWNSMTVPSDATATPPTAAGPSVPSSTAPQQ